MCDTVSLGNVTVVATKQNMQLNLRIVNANYPKASKELRTTVHITLLLIVLHVGSFPFYLNTFNILNIVVNIAKYSIFSYYRGVCSNIPPTNGRF